MAKQMKVMATREMIYGKTTRILWPSGRGPEKRAWEILSIGPMRMMERVVLAKGFMMVAVASV
jgi:hypothetical protein